MQTNYHLGEEGKRPWGTWKVIAMGKGYIVKKIIVNPLSSLSLQLHHHRGEHWLIAKGTAHITLSSSTFDLSQGSCVDIPPKTPHRIQNLTPSPLEFIEIQLGKILNEEDIVRFRDSYGRE